MFILFKKWQNVTPIIILDVNLPNPHNESKSKRRKTDPEANTPYITTDKPGSNQIIANFIIASNCWDLLHSSEALHRGIFIIFQINTF